MDTIEYLSTKDVLAFIKKQDNADIQKLILNPPAPFKEKIILLADQIISRKKAKEKLPEWFQKEGVIMPPPISLEQASSSITAEYKSSFFKGEELIDLTGGMGIDSLTLSSGFTQSTYVEQNGWLCSLFKYNSSLLSTKNFTIINDTAEHFLKGFEGTASFYIDPGRRDASKKVFQFEDCSPNLIELLPELDKKSDQVLVKASPMLDIQRGILQLGKVTEVHVISVNNECKELLFLRDSSTTSPEPKILCVNIDMEKTDPFIFTYPDEKEIEVDYRNEIGNYLYDPNTSILKAGAFKSLVKHYPIQKIAANTHLYTSDQLCRDFPGRIFKVINKNPGKKQIEGLVKSNVITKNYPLKAEEVKRRFKLQDGGDDFVFGFTLSSKQHQLVIAARLK